mmetsp:Transcript_39369/g.100927  ORF Transcript_39369/g.100927 Transcript_39369/m.100927 type:complete len:726 (-) Transcript_39369:278-2455(-)
MKPSAWDGAAVFVVVCAALIAFDKSTSFGFVFDDDVAVEKNMLVISPNATLTDYLTRDFWGVNMSSKYSHKSFRPLTTLSFRLNYLAERSPRLFHATNVYMHAAVSALLYFVSLFAFKQGRGGAAVASLLFALHPVHTEAVANVTGRSEMMYSLFFAAALLVRVWVDGVDGEQCVTRSVVNGVVVPLLYLLALTSKETAAVLPAFFIAEGVFHHLCARVNESGRGKGEGKSEGRQMRFISTLIQLGGMGVVAIVYSVWRTTVSGGRLTPNITHLDNPLVAVNTTLDYTSIWFVINAYYVRLVMWPSRLSPDYSYSCFPTSLSSPLFPSFFSSSLAWVAAALCVFALALYLAGKRGRTQYVWTALAWYIILMLPASNTFILVGTTVGERLLYLPSFAFCVLIAEFITAVGEWHTTEKKGVGKVQSGKERAGKSGIASRFAKVGGRIGGVVAIAVVVGVAVVMMTASLRAVDMWQNKTTLFEAAAEVCPTSAKVQKALGSNYAHLADVAGGGKKKIEKAEAGSREHALMQKAVHHYRLAVSIKPDFTEAVYELGICELRAGYRDEGRATLRRNLELRPSSYKTFNALAFAYLEDGMMEAALPTFLDCLYYAWDSEAQSEMATNIGNILSTLPPRTPLSRLQSQQGGKASSMTAREAAISYYLLSTRLRPRSADAVFNMGVLYLNSGGSREAAACFAKAVRLNPGEQEYRRALTHAVSQVKAHHSSQK